MNITVFTDKEFDQKGLKKMLDLLPYDITKWSGTPNICVIPIAPKGDANAVVIVSPNGLYQFPGYGFTGNAAEFISATNELTSSIQDFLKKSRINAQVHPSLY